MNYMYIYIRLCWVGFLLLGVTVRPLLTAAGVTSGAPSSALPYLLKPGVGIQAGTRHKYNSAKIRSVICP